VLPHKKIELKLQAAVREILPHADVSAVLVRPCDPKFGDYQSNALMSLAKMRKMNPRQLAADTLAQRYTARTRRRLKQLGAALGILPWALFVLFAAKGIVLSSVLGLEAFADTNNPGYFIIKAALWLMAVVIIAQAAVDIFRPKPADDV